LYLSKEMQEIVIMKRLSCLFLMFQIFTVGIARADDPGLPGGDPDVPLDGGMVVLLIAGAYYGVKKIRGSKQDKM
jgi:hypothetical protein